MIKMKLYHLLLLQMLITGIPLKNFAEVNYQNNSADTAINYLFIEWRHWNNTVVLGRFSENKLKRIEETVCLLKDLDQQMLNKWLQDSTRAALFSFHCMWGQQPWFHRLKYLSSFTKVLSTAGQSNIRTVISFIWHAGGINYKKNWNKAAGKGELLGELLAVINQYYKFKTYVFCHSMGSRFFEGILKTLPEQSSAFKAVILFSADLPAEINLPEFKRIQIVADTIIVFKHQKDKLLLISSLIFKGKRLGRSGPSPLNEIKKMTVFDMTENVRGFQNHAHVNKKWPQKILIDFFNAHK